MLCWGGGLFKLMGSSQHNVQLPMVTWLNACVKVQQLWLPAFSGLWNTYCINIYIYIHIYSYTVNRPLSRCCYVTQTKDGKVFRINIANLQIKWKRKKAKYVHKLEQPWRLSWLKLQKFWAKRIVTAHIYWTWQKLALWIKKTESRRNRARERERLTPLSDMAPVFINLKESESLSCPSDRRGRFPI